MSRCLWRIGAPVAGGETYRTNRKENVLCMSVKWRKGERRREGCEERREEEGGCEERRDMRGLERRRECCEEKGGRRHMK